MRREFSKAVKIAAFQRAGGRCECCTTKLTAGKFQYDHAIADGLGGEPTLENCVVLCRACHGVKTANHDVPAIARAKRREAIHIGAKPPSRAPLPFGRKSRWKRKFDGTIVERG
jgi:5-methylcytosine-specific restriction enzyme A